jgi:hypothetical protein
MMLEGKDDEKYRMAIPKMSNRYHTLGTEKEV